MEFYRASLHDCASATGTVVVIDVLRAFTTAAFAFAAGAQDITLVSTVEEAFALRKRMPGSLIMGEVDGNPVKGFDFDNSPTAIAGMDLRGQRLIQRTTAGTKGVVLSAQADTLLASSLVCAGATAGYIKSLSPKEVTFVITGQRSGGWGDEDAACADYIEALLRGEKPDVKPFIQRVRESPPGQFFSDPAQPEFLASDLEHSTDVDRFDFAMLVKCKDGLLKMDTVR